MVAPGAAAPAAAAAEAAPPAEARELSLLRQGVGPADDMDDPDRCENDLDCTPSSLGADGPPDIILRAFHWKPKPK